MPFGVKNGLPTYRRAITKMFHEYIFFDDFTNFNDVLNHFEKLKKRFLSVERLVLA
jgi:hypothetical protein